MHFVPLSKGSISEAIVAARCPRSIHDGFAALAARHGKSTSELLRELIERALGGDGTNRPPPPAAVAA